MKWVTMIIAAFACAIGCSSAAAQPAPQHNPPGISLALELDKQQAYLQESIPVTVILRTHGVSVRNIGYPQLTAIGLNSSSFLPPEQIPEKDGHAEITSYRFRGSIRAVRPGSFTVGPATVTCDILDAAEGSAAFFGAREPRPVTVVSPSAPLTIMPLPTEGRPTSFSGAVGDFTMHAIAQPAAAAIGDPLTVTTVIRGTGSLAAATCPVLSGPGLRSYPVRAHHTDAMLRCEQVIIPVQPGPLPVLAWSYFAPRDGIYRSLRVTFPVTVSASPFTTISSNRPPVQTAQVSQDRFTVSLFIYTFLAGLALCIGMLAYRRVHFVGRKPRPASRHSGVFHEYRMLLADVDEAYTSSDVDKFYTFVMQILQGALGAETGLPPQAITSVPPAYTSNKLINVKEISQILQRCHQVRYGRYQPHPDELKRDLQFIKNVVAYLLRT